MHDSAAAVAHDQAETMNAYVLDLREIDAAQIALAGGKGAHLGELTRIDGVNVPPGFCVTTPAFRRMLAEVPSIDDALDGLARLEPGDLDAIRALAVEVRRAVESVAIPVDLASAIGDAIARHGERAAYAVRSSATAEDLPTASFAGQQDTYLAVAGREEILRHVRRCWASLYTERAVAYRLHTRIDHRSVCMAVLVQRMVDAEVSGILFTADPVTGNRKVASIEAIFGLGEALVSGRVNADVYEVRDDAIVARAIAAKPTAIVSSSEGGTREVAIQPERQESSALTDEQVLRLARLGRRIEAHFGRPQDIEWCVAGDDVHVVQSRPITTLFPIPAASDSGNHVYISVGHQQMMTDAMKPLGISFWQLTAARPMHEAGGRLFVDVTRELGVPTVRASLLGLIGKSDPLIADAIDTILARDGFVPSLADQAPPGPPSGAAPAELETDPAIVEELIARSETSVATLKREIRSKSGPALLEFVRDDIGELKRILFDARSHRAIMAGMEAAWWLNDRMQEWLGEKNAADTLAQSVPDNVTSEMGLALLDVADAIRPHAEVVAFLQRAGASGDHETFLGELPELDGGREAHDAIRAWLDRYGMRCPGEIDITRPRWSERPAMLLPALLGNVRHFAAGESARRFEQGRREAEEKEREVLGLLRALPDGERKADETKRMIDRLRTFTGYREYPKYGMVSRYFVYKLALLEEAERLARAGVLRAPDDVFFLSLHELHDVVRGGRVDEALVRERRDAFESYRALVPPRVLTSEGEAVSGSYRCGDVPAGALVGLPVSAGLVEGRARVVLDMARADLEPGDILVTAFTDPSWTPLFVAIAGLVTEVGGLMTHGAVIAREYGLPAVVGVEHATRVIRDGQRIRVHGTEGYVEILS